MRRIFFPPSATQTDDDHHVNSMNQSSSSSRREKNKKKTLSLSLSVLVSYKCTENELDSPEWQVTGIKHRLHGENENLVKACNSSAAAIRSASWKEKWSSNWTWRWARTGAEEEESTKEKFSRRSTCILTTQLLLPLPLAGSRTFKGPRDEIPHHTFIHYFSFSSRIHEVRTWQGFFVHNSRRNPRTRWGFRSKACQESTKKTSFSSKTCRTVTGSLLSTFFIQLASAWFSKREARWRGFRVLGLTVSTRARNRSSKETRTHTDRGRWSSDPPLSLWKSLHQERERERKQTRAKRGGSLQTRHKGSLAWFPTQGDLF